MRGKKLFVTGVMTGTSSDGLDLCLLSIPGGDSRSWIVEAFGSFSFTKETANLILSCQETEVLNKKEYVAFSGKIAQFAATRVRKFLEEHFHGKVPTQLAVAYHGQTIGHFPEKRRIGKRGYSGTLQAGEAAMIAEITGRTTVSDFRQADVASGGEGAPLTPLFHAPLLAGNNGVNAFLNVGGIGNISVVEKGKILAATDTGPGNILIDGAVRLFSGGNRKFDRDGRWGKKGSVSDRLLAFLRAQDHFLKRKKPASTGREQYGRSFLDGLVKESDKIGISEADVISTLTFYTAFCVSEYLKKNGYGKIRKVYVGGGGASNSLFMDMLSSLLVEIDVVTSSSLGIPPGYVEAAAMAYLGYLCLAGISVDTSAFTGGGKGILGKITPETNFPSLMNAIHG
jgi:anhydro-N-acetylmuramic acid kinase